MDSLTKILTKIEEDNKCACEQILSDAVKQAEQIIADAKQKAEKQKQAILTEGEKQAADRLARINSSAELIYKRKLLAARVEIIDDTLKSALERLSSLPKEEYFNLLIGLAERYAEIGDGVLMLNDADFARAPKDFAEKIASATANKGKVTVSGGADCKWGGFKLCYSETVINCGFDALLNDSLDDAKDTLSKILFE